MKKAAQGPRRVVRVLLVLLSLVALDAGLGLASSAHVGAPEPRHVVVLRVHFEDREAVSRFTQAEVQGMMAQMSSLWRNTSYGAIRLSTQVSTLYALPSPRSDYVTDEERGDVTRGSRLLDLLEDAIAGAPDGIDWSSTDVVLVLMAETGQEMHRGVALRDCDVPRGPGGGLTTMGCIAVSENPTETPLQAWGRWMHEVGHTFQRGGPAHPSDYRNEFELMDSNYPGHTGAFEKMKGLGFDGWLPEAKYQVVRPSSGGADAHLYTLERGVDDKPNAQAVKVQLTGSLYYLVTLRRRVMGDELNGGFQDVAEGRRGIPDEGILIERVSEGGTPWVKVLGPEGYRNRLWHRGETYDAATYPDDAVKGDGVVIAVLRRPDDPDNYGIQVRFTDNASRPDVMLQPWLSPPGDTWETTDIWVDSPVNGYGVHRYGTWNDLFGNPVPRGNGDDPAIGQENRLYARVRNVGTAPATNVVVRWERTEPMGLGISGLGGWVPVGHVGKDVPSSSAGAGFPELASIPPGGFVDVWVPWTPAMPYDVGDSRDVRIAFHTCLRVKLDAVEGETVLGNQDGEREQENIGHFFVPAANPVDGGDLNHTAAFRLTNDDSRNERSFLLSFDPDLPDGWRVAVNRGDLAPTLKPGESREIPVVLTSRRGEPVGSSFGVDVSASYERLLVSDLDPRDTHVEQATLGGVRFEARVVEPTSIECDAVLSGDVLHVRGRLVFHLDAAEGPPVVMLQAWRNRTRPLHASTVLADVDPEGRFEARLAGFRGEPSHALCAFAGTTKLDAAAHLAEVVTGGAAPPDRCSLTGPWARGCDPPRYVGAPVLLVFAGLLGAVALRRRRAG